MFLKFHSTNFDHVPTLLFTIFDKHEVLKFPKTKNHLFGKPSKSKRRRPETSAGERDHDDGQGRDLRPTTSSGTASTITTFAEMKLCAPLLRTCAALGYKRPTSVQRAVLQNLYL